jgi:cytochrome oxidase Cu insertion factor (SCO1/SenC/PrrC family)
MSKPAKSAPAPGTFSWWPYALAAGVVVATVAFLIVNHFGANSPTGDGPGDGLNQRGLSVGAVVPVVPLRSTEGTTVSLDQLKGSKVVVYFYESSG